MMKSELENLINRFQQYGNDYLAACLYEILNEILRLQEEINKFNLYLGY